MLKDGIVVFFYVNNIVFCYQKTDEKKAQKAIKELSKKYQISTLGKLKWFLGIHMLYNHSQRLLWLSQEAYIEKIANQYKIDLKGCLLDTSMAESELLSTDYQLIHPMLLSPDIDLLICPISLLRQTASTMLYQRKMGSVLYAATTTCPDIAFAVLWLAKFNQDPSQEHHQVADRVIQYLYGIRGRAIYYRGDTEGMNGKGRDKRTSNKEQDNGKNGRSEVQLFICASNASFADNSINRKSLQRYIIKLFGGPIAWRANKQDTVMMLSTEAELLALL